MAQLKLVAPTCESPTPHAIASVAGRLDEMLSRYLGDAIISAVADEDVTEVYVNPQDGLVRLDTHSRGRTDAGCSNARMPRATRPTSRIT